MLEFNVTKKIICVENILEHSKLVSGSFILISMDERMVGVFALLLTLLSRLSKLVGQIV